MKQTSGATKALLSEDVSQSAEIKTQNATEHLDVTAEKDKLHVKRHRGAARARFCWPEPGGSAQPVVIDTPMQTLFSPAKYKPARKYGTQTRLSSSWSRSWHNPRLHLFPSAAPSTSHVLHLYIFFSASLSLHQHLHPASGRTIHLQRVTEEYLS